MSQLAFGFPVRPDFGRGAFVVTAANRTAFALVEATGAWPQGRLALAGPAGSGKSHLAALWRETTGAEAVPAGGIAARAGGAALSGGLLLEDADRSVPGDPAAEEGLLHLLNRAAEARVPVLLTARAAPSRWGAGLPDLASRLGAMAVATLGAPDDALLSALLAKHLADRQIAADPALIGFLLPRIERTAAAAAGIAERLDRAALAAGRPVTVRLAAEVLAG